MSSAANGDLVMEQMANTGQLMCVFAGCFPPADEMAWRIPKGVGGPMALNETSEAWKAGAAALQEIQSQLREQTAALDHETWDGKDRAAFEHEVSSLLAELGDSHNTAEAIGITLEVLCPVMAVWPPLCLTVGMAVAACATAFYLAAASGIGDLVGASEAAYGAGLPVAEAMLTTLTVAESVLTAALGVAQGVIAAAVFTDVVAQKGHGDTAIVGDLKQAEVDGIGQVTVNLAQYGVSRALDGKDPGAGEGGAGEAGGGEAGGGDAGGGDAGGGEAGGGDAGSGNEPGSGGDSPPPDPDGTPPGDTPGNNEPGNDDPGNDDPGSGKDDSGDDGDGGPEVTSPPWGKVGGEAGKIGVDTAQHQAADRTHAGSRLQDLINDMSGWQGTE